MMSIDSNDCVFKAFATSARQHAAKPFLRMPASSVSASTIDYTYEEAAARVLELFAGYTNLGVSAGHRVVLAFDSCVEIYLHVLALNALAASVVPINSLGTDAELTHIIRHSDSQLVVALPEHRSRLQGLTQEMQTVDVVVESDFDTHGDAPVAAGPSSTTEAALLYTSGTTDQPKGCMLSNEYFLSIGRWYVGLGGLCKLDGHDRLLTPLPPNHMNALCTSFTAMMLCGGCVIQLDRFHPRIWWKTIREERATVIHCLGVMTAILLSLPEEDQENFSAQVKFAFAPGSDPNQQAKFESRFGFPLIEAWAMTESGAGGMTIANEEPRHVGTRCIGKPVATMDYLIVDEKDAPVPRGQPGELLVRAADPNPRRGFFSGYYKDVDATEEGWRGGWWHTGDVVREGDDGALFFVDRRKNVIRRSGENIAAVEVEGVLLRLPAVTNCAVCAVPDDIRGDEVFAFVVLSEGAETTDAQTIFKHCIVHLTYFKAPGYIALVNELPLTASQKVNRGEVKNLARECLDRGDCVDLREFKKRNS